MPQPKTPKIKLLQPGDRFLTGEETAKILGTTVNTLSFWRVMGHGPSFYRHGRSIRYLLSDVTAWATKDFVEPKSA
jgi:hypothetical protein